MENSPMNLVVPRRARLCREGWEQSMLGQLEAEQEAEEGALLSLLTAMHVHSPS